MKFGNCIECNKYKYLKEEGQCPTCYDSDGWFVYRIIGISDPHLVHSGLSKTEAEEKAESDQHLLASDKKLR